jgi:hypothetical protein
MAAGESTGERLDRELMELLQELRVVLPGVQVLLAFLLVAPFQPRFAQLPGSLRNAFFASVACATLATALLIAPSAHHRLRWRAHDKERLVRVGNQMALWGTVFLAAAIVLAVYVVTNVLYVSQLALLTAGVAVVVFGWVWYGLPLIGHSPAADDEAKATEPPGADLGKPSADSRGPSPRR